MRLAFQVRRAQRRAVQFLNRKRRCHLAFPTCNRALNNLVETWIGLHLLNIYLCNLSCLGIAREKPWNTPVVFDDFQDDIGLAFYREIKLMRDLSQGGWLLGRRVVLSNVKWHLEENVVQAVEHFALFGRREHFVVEFAHNDRLARPEIDFQIANDLLLNLSIGLCKTFATRNKKCQKTRQGYCP